MDIWKVILSIVFSFLFTYLVIPSLIKIAESKKLFVTKDSRRSHNTNISALGGVAIFLGALFSFAIFIDYVEFREFKFLISGGVILFLIGLRDDLYPVNPFLKLSTQLISSIIVVVLGNIRITDFQGLFGIYEVNYYISILLSIVLIIGIINSFNMIDGINMLASLMALIILLLLGSWFFISEQFDIALVLFALGGSTLAFLRYNGPKPKIFMGDTGSHIIGLILAVALILFIELNKNQNLNFHIHAAPAVAYGLLCIPLFDMIRVAALRIYRKRSPFSPDKNHIHHLMVLSGLTHKQTSIILAVLSLTIISLNYLLQRFKIDVNLLMIINFLIPSLFSYFVAVKIKSKNRGKMKI